MFESGMYKSFCCKNPTPEPFQNCGWHMKETHLLSQGKCETSCPIDQIKVGMDDMDESEQSTCKGPAAYCCRGIQRPVLLPSSTSSPTAPSPTNCKALRRRRNKLNYCIESSTTTTSSLSITSATLSPSKLPLMESPSQMQRLADFSEAAGL
jgi:hypothetical protein